jgi:geranylgeranyl transferase type-2 subunit beta
MISGPAVTQLTEHFVSCLAQLSPDFRSRHGRYIVSLQCSDGGFRGRGPQSALYYTSFALHGLAALGALNEATVDAVSAYLRGQLPRTTTVVDAFALLCAVSLARKAGRFDPASDLPADWEDGVTAFLETCHKDDGGYGRSAETKTGSTYLTLLASLSYRIMNRDIPSKASVLDFVLSRRREDGGFVEVEPAQRSGTNPTAAGIGLLLLLDGATADVADQAAGFLGSMQTAEGGLRANCRAPAADLLSTFSGLLTLVNLGRERLLDLAAVQRFVQACESPAGGFRGGLWDSEADIEYTFYGLGVSALLA